MLYQMVYFKGNGAAKKSSNALQKWSFSVGAATIDAALWDTPEVEESYVLWLPLQVFRCSSSLFCAQHCMNANAITYT